MIVREVDVVEGAEMLQLLDVLKTVVTQIQRNNTR